MFHACVGDSWSKRGSASSMALHREDNWSPTLASLGDASRQPLAGTHFLFACQCCIVSLSCNKPQVLKHHDLRSCESALAITLSSCHVSAQPGAPPVSRWWARVLCHSKLDLKTRPPLPPLLNVFPSILQKQSLLMGRGSKFGNVSTY